MGYNYSKHLIILATPFHSGSSVMWHHNILIAPSIWRVMNEPEDGL
jgi:hypothetical protein